MKQIRLFRLKLKNFKGVEEYELELDGKGAAIVGTNETGKTTLADAYRWLLFDVDSHGNSRFQIKPLDKNNEPIHHLHSVVEGDLQVITPKGVKEFTLKKDYHEVWQDKGTKNIFKGHTTDYYIDEEPVNKKTYDAYISEVILDEQIFSLITEPLYFNEQLHWKEQRDILFDMVEKPEPTEVATKAEKYYLAEKLEDKTVKQHRKVLKSKMTKLKNKLDEIPARIDEIENGLSAEGLDRESTVDKLEQELEELREKQEKLQEEKAGGDISLKEQLIELKDKKSNKKEKLMEQANEILGEIRSKMSEKEGDINRLKQNIEFSKDKIEQLEKKRKELLEKYHEWKEKEFSKEDGVCPCCNQKLPEDKLEEHRKEFNEKKAGKLEKIKAQGQEVKATIEQEKEDVEDTKQAIKAIEEEYEKLEKREEKGKEFKESIDENERLKELNEQIEELEEKIEEGGDDKEKEDELFQVKKEIIEAEKKLANMESIEKAKERISSLQEQEEKLVSKYEQHEKELHDLSIYLRTQIEMTEDDINNMFDVAEFKLFEEQVNGDLKETCQAMKNGVPYESLNTGSQYQVGMDIIKTLNNYYDTQAPIIIDNRERIASLPMLEAQTIHLIMAPKRKELTKLNVYEEEIEEYVEESAGVQEKLF